MSVDCETVEYNPKPIKISKRPMLFTGERKQRFLQALADGHSITRAANAAGVARRTVYLHREQDPEFAEAWSVSFEEGTDVLEDLMLEKAKKDNGFLPNIAILKARRPEVWGDRAKVDVSNQRTLRIIIDSVESIAEGT